jgi:DNA (cytosine-5)-methyltransferase 1
MDLPESAAGVESAINWKTYSVSRSGKEPLLKFILDALQMRGCSIVFASEPTEAPFYIVFETPAGERHGVLAYAFLANTKTTRNRPEDEHRFQIKYGSELTGNPSLRRAPNGCSINVLLSPSRRRVEGSLALKAISLYSGVGGLDFGFEAAGFETAVALDLDPVACRSLRLNRRWPVLQGDISDISSADILGRAGLGFGEADVLIGGPPCQPFSKSGYWATGDAKRLEDPRAGTLGQYLRVVRDTLPKTFLLENVLGLAYAGKSEGLEFVRRGVAEIKAATGVRYALSVKAMNAAEYGVPQVRERVLIVGDRRGRNFDFPSPTHAPPAPAASSGLQPYRTTWDALGDLEQDNPDPALTMSGKWAELLPSIPEGGNYLWHTPRGGGAPIFGWRTRYWNFLLKLAKDQPSWTIQAQPGPATGPFHWKNRKLSAAELGRLQTFPDGLRYDASRSEVQRMIGNAVPSALAEAIAVAIRGQLLGEPRALISGSLVPPARGPVPKPELPSAVPRKYHALLGDHRPRRSQRRRDWPPFQLTVVKPRTSTAAPSWLTKFWATSAAAAASRMHCPFIEPE